MTLTLSEIAAIVTISFLISGGINFWSRKWMADKFLSIDKDLLRLDGKVNDIKTDAEHNEKEMQHMKNNYTDKFNEVIDKINELHLTVVNLFHGLDKKVDQQAKTCEFIQSQKRGQQHGK